MFARVDLEVDDRAGTRAGRAEDREVKARAATLVGLGPGVVSLDASVGGAPLPATTLTRSIVPSTGDGYGNYIYDPSTKILRWTIPKLLPSTSQRPCLLKLTWTTGDARSLPTHSSGITVGWTNPTQGLSHLKVDSVNLTNTNTHAYRPFKGVRSFSKGKLVYRV